MDAFLLLSRPRYTFRLVANRQFSRIEGQCFVVLMRPRGTKVRTVSTMPLGFGSPSKYPGPAKEILPSRARVTKLARDGETPESGIRKVCGIPATRGIRNVNYESKQTAGLGHSSKQVSGRAGSCDSSC